MNLALRKSAFLFGAIAIATLASAEDRAVFSLSATNGSETIRGGLVLNREAVRTTTADGFSFATPVDFLYYTISDASGVLADFMLQPENPNALTITKEPDGSTRFHLLVEPVPTDPPFPMPPAFVMEFSFPGDAPWGDSIPDRTVEGATNVTLGASDLYNQSVVIEEVTLQELTKELRQLNDALKNVRKYLPRKN